MFSFWLAGAVSLQPQIAMKAAATSMLLTLSVQKMPLDFKLFSQQNDSSKYIKAEI